MNDDALYSIGDLARRTGLPVRTIRFYSDSGVLPRELGLDLVAIRRIIAALEYHRPG